MKRHSSLSIREQVRARLFLSCLLALMLSFAATASASPTNPPPGPYTTSCQAIRMDGTTLRASCANYFGGHQDTGLADAAACTGTFKDVNGGTHNLSIRNVDGTLRCVIAASLGHGKYQEEFDIISRPHTESYGSQGATITDWRIDRPIVWSGNPEGRVDYSMITFKPGDKIHISAGGCVQTGGHGATWKSYTDPSGPDADQYYSGTIFISDVTMGRFQKIGPFMRSGWKTIPPAPPGARPSHMLQLGYLDNEMDDNGYYSHDNGNNDQCKNIGPAWVEVRVISGLPQSSGPLLSPHSKPFDLVWDMEKDEDPNGLPMNPQWNYTLQHPGAQPHFIPLCGAAFPSQFLVGTYKIDMGTLARICTSMSPDFDLHPMGGGICGGDPFPGHLDFGVATYQGYLTWEAWSGNAAGTQDNDWSFALRPRNGAGLAGKDDSLAPGTNIHSEFDIGEALPLMGSAWWHQLFLPVPDMPIPGIDKFFAGPTGAGLDAVVIGEVGLDGVHGANTELHPVFAMAVRVSELRDKQRPDVMVDQWAFFLRNFGDGGFCSSMLSFWETGGDYFIPLEYPANTTKVVGVERTEVTRWQEAPTPVGIQDDADQHFTLIRVTPPPGGGGWGVSGLVTLAYNVLVPDKKTAKAAPPPQTQPPKPQYVETEGKNMSPDRIADPTVRAKYEAELKALGPMMKSRPATTFAVEVPTTVTPHKHLPGAAAHGVLVRARVTPNTTKLQWDAQMYKVVQTYQKDLKIALPAEMPAELKTAAAQPATK